MKQLTMEEDAKIKVGAKETLFSVPRKMKEGRVAPKQWPSPFCLYPFVPVRFKPLAVRSRVKLPSSWWR